VSSRLSPSRSSTVPVSVPAEVAGIAVRVTVRPSTVAARPVVVAMRATVTLRSAETDSAYVTASLGTNVAV
jgi:hypothetical protein